MTDFKRIQGKSPIVKKLFISVAITAITVLALSFVCALISEKQGSSSAEIKIYSFAVLILASLLSGFVNSKRSSVKESILSSFLCTLIMLLVGIILSAGKTEAGAFMNYACFFLLSSAGAYLGKKRVKKARRHRR